MLLYLPKSQRRQRGFDLFGFAMLASRVGALQMMLDRGDQLDWFASAEIWLELGLAVSGAWVFVVHIATAGLRFRSTDVARPQPRRPHWCLIFMVGVILLAGLALMPPMLQNILGYPVISTGMVLAPRGVGTMISMILVGRLVRQGRCARLIFFGLSVDRLLALRR